MRGRCAAAGVALLVGVLFVTVAADEKKPTDAYPFVFRDVGDEAGVFPALTGIRGHGAGWGDVDGDGFIDLYVATFHTAGAKPNQFLRNDGKGKFTLDDQEGLRISTRGTGVIFADLDNDGDLDLYVGSMPQTRKRPGDTGPVPVGCTLFRNDGKGKFTNVSKDNGACPAEFGGRSATVLDYDGDGLLDLLVGEDPIPGYNGSKTKSSRLFRNKGDLQFEDVSRAVGLPEGVPGLGVAAADVNNDGWPDIFLASPSGGNVLFLNDGKGKFVEAEGSRKAFAWEGSGGDNMICGVCFGDVNRDGLLDIVLGQHYSTPWLNPVPSKLYLNRGLTNEERVIPGGIPRYEDVSAKAGVKPLPLKAPHVELQDFDNDGWPDLYVSMVKFADGKPYPVIFKHLGVKDGMPQFREDALAVNDFPTAEDVKIKRSGEMFDKVIKEKKVIYMAPGPSGDYDNDGRIDLFLPNWWAESRSLLLHNETKGGNWLQVQLDLASGGRKPSEKVNRMGIGARVKVYAAGKLGQADALHGMQEIATGYGYASGQPAIAHFGLGKDESVDVEVTLPHGKGKLTRKGVKANQRITVKQ